MSIPPVKGRRRCCVIAVVGFSGSGKSTVAHFLARELASPFHPITVDDFFDAARCEALDSFDDCRTLDFEKFISAIEGLKSFLERTVEGEDMNDLSHAKPLTKKEGKGGCHCLPCWREKLKKELPLIAKCLITPATGNSLGEDVMIASGCEENNVQDNSTESNEEEKEEEGSVSDDSSLLAHKEERRRWCRVTVAAAAKRAENLGKVRSYNYHRPTTTTSAIATTNSDRKDEKEEVVYVVCEGISMFCEPGVLGLRASEAHAKNLTPGKAKSALFDYCVSLEGDFEAACLRRFLRTPRHHSGSKSHLPRIRKMWSTRTDRRRSELCCFLSDAFRAPLMGARLLPPDLAEEIFRRREQAEDACQRLLRVDGLFFPPLPAPVRANSAVKGDEAFWCATFADFWRLEYQPSSLEREGRPVVEDWATFSPNSEAFVSEALKMASANTPYSNSTVVETTWPSFSSFSSSSLRSTQSWKGQLGMYLKFRYWFFFEVLYYHHLFEPLQSFYLSLYAALARVSGVREMPVLKINNTRQLGIGKVEDQVKVAAEHICSHCRSIG